jgi:hypothetical protein
VSEELTFSGAIVLKAKTKVEVEALAAQLSWYAVFEDAFHNRYEGGYAMRGQVRSTPTESAPNHTVLQTQIREQAAQIGQLQEQVARLTREHAHAAEQAAYQKKFLDLLTQEEHWRLIGRNVGERGIAVVEASLGDEVLQLLAREVLERAARSVEVEGPDHPHITQRAADACAALIRALKAAPLTTTPEDAARQAERAMAIAERFRELFGGSDHGTR